MSRIRKLLNLLLLSICFTLNGVAQRVFIQQMDLSRQSSYAVKQLAKALFAKVLKLLASARPI
ncbi:hypothetical protein [Spirosoma litoris]